MYKNIDINTISTIILYLGNDILYTHNSLVLL